jgi:hypothetical protein
MPAPRKFDIETRAAATGTMPVSPLSATDGVLWAYGRQFDDRLPEKSIRAMDQ